MFEKALHLLTPAVPSKRPPALPAFHPATTIRSWGEAGAFHLSSATTGVAIIGATGSGKTSGPGKHLALGYLRAGFGGLVLCSKTDELATWKKWAAAAGRTDDLVVVDAAGGARFNFLADAAQSASEGAGLTINVTALLSELARSFSGRNGKKAGSGSDKFWADSLDLMLTNMVDLCILAGEEVTIPRMRLVSRSSPRSLAEAQNKKWQEESLCYQLILKAYARANDDDTRTTLTECVGYWLQEYAGLAEKTRSIIEISFSSLIRPFLTPPLYRLFSTDTTHSPQDILDGKIVIVALDALTYGQVGLFAALVWKYTTQKAILRRKIPTDGTYLRPAFIWADEAQMFVSDFHYMFQSVARSSAGATVYIFQTRASLIDKLGSEHQVNALLSNLQAKFLCQQTDVDAEWCSRFLGNHWMKSLSTSTNRAGSENATTSAGATMQDQQRLMMEAQEFTVLARGGDAYGKRVECICYDGGRIFDNGLPFTRLTFNQEA